jgi:acetylornithine deacetylase/succinyl-diaminopimelate desuccinylase-like protein
VKAVTPPGVTVDIKDLHGGRPWKAKLQGPAYDAAREALEEAYGTTPVPMGGGGSIPIVIDFEEQLEAPALLLGFAQPDCNLHAPDEWLRLEDFDKGIRTLALLYGKLAG